MAKAKQTELQTELPKLPKQRFELMLSATLQNLIRLEPRNPAVRALILRQTGYNVPPELETFDAVKNWLECQEPLVKAPVEILVPVDASEFVTGTCSYSQWENGHGRVKLTSDDVVALAADADGDYDEFRQLLHDKIVDLARDTIQLDHTDDAEFDDYHEKDRSEYSINFNGPTVMDNAMSILRSASPAEWAKLTGEEPAF